MIGILLFVALAELPDDDHATRRAALDLRADEVAVLPCRDASSRRNVEYRYLVGPTCVEGSFVVVRADGQQLQVHPAEASSTDVASVTGLARWVHGLEVRSVRVPFSALQVMPEVRRAVPTLERIVDLSPTVARHRAIKSDSESRAIEASAKAAGEAMRTALQHVRVGATEREIDAVFHAEAERSGHGVAFSLVLMGERTLAVHGPGAPDVPGQEGELLLMDVGLMVDDYASDVTRTVPIGGDFDDLQRSIHDVVEQALRRGADALRPGRTLGDVRVEVDAALTEGLRQLGIVGPTQGLGRLSPHGWVHFVGLEVHDAWKHYERDADSVVLERGMVLALEPGLYLRASELAGDVDPSWAGIGIRIEEMYLVTQDGARPLSGLPTSAAAMEALLVRGRVP